MSFGKAGEYVGDALARLDQNRNPNREFFVWNQTKPELKEYQPTKHPNQQNHEFFSKIIFSKKLFSRGSPFESFRTVIRRDRHLWGDRAEPVEVRGAAGGYDRLR